MKEGLMFGIFHTDCRKDEKKFRELVASDFVNVFLVEGDPSEPAFSENFEILKNHPEKTAFISRKLRYKNIIFKYIKPTYSS